MIVRHLGILAYLIDARIGRAWIVVVAFGRAQTSTIRIVTVCGIGTPVGDTQIDGTRIPIITVRSGLTTGCILGWTMNASIRLAIIGRTGIEIVTLRKCVATLGILDGHIFAVSIAADILCAGVIVCAGYLIHTGFQLAFGIRCAAGIIRQAGAFPLCNILARSGLLIAELSDSAIFLTGTGGFCPIFTKSFQADSTFALAMSKTGTRPANTVIAIFQRTALIMIDTGKNRR